MFEGQGSRSRSLQGQIFELLQQAEASASMLGRQSIILFVILPSRVVASVYHLDCSYTLSVRVMLSVYIASNSLVRVIKYYFSCTVCNIFVSVVKKLCYTFLLMISSIPACLCRQACWLVVNGHYPVWVPHRLCPVLRQHTRRIILTDHKWFVYAACVLLILFTAAYAFRVCSMWLWLLHLISNLYCPTRHK